MRGQGLLLVAAMIGLAGRAGSTLGGARADRRAGRFTDVTVPSGVADVVSAHYRNVPKWWLSGMTLVDLDGDGDLDLHLAGHGHPAAVAVNDGKGRFSYVDPKLSLRRGVRHDNDIPYPGGEARLCLDFNEDGRIDILTSWHDGGGVLYLNDWLQAPGRSQFRFRRCHDLDVFCRGCAVFDVDRDGKADFLSDAGDRIAVRFGKGDGTFREKVGEIPGSFRQSGFIPADVNADGHVDLLMHGCTGGNFYSGTPFRRRILLSDGPARFADFTAKSGLDAGGGSIHGAGDVNHDGHVDLICVEGKSISIHLNDGRGRFTPRTGAVRGLDKVRNKPRLLPWGGAVVADFDNDGVADVAVVGRYYLYVLRGLGDGRFAYANTDWHLPNQAWSAVDEGLCFGDIDGDGMLDLVTCGPGPGGKSKGVLVFRNDLPKRHWLRVRLRGAEGNRSAAGAKIRVYASGPAARRRKLLWYEQVSIWGRQSFHSYYAAAGTERHFGLGDHRTVDVDVEFHPSGRRVERRGVRADTIVEIRHPSP